MFDSSTTVPKKPMNIHSSRERSSLSPDSISLSGSRASLTCESQASATGPGSSPGLQTEGKLPSSAAFSKARFPGFLSNRPQSCPTQQPHGLQPTRLLHLRNFPGKSTGVGCHFLLQGIFLTQGTNPGLPIAGGFFTVWATRKTPLSLSLSFQFPNIISSSSTILLFCFLDVGHSVFIPSKG